jgi:hypothetical protein
MTTCTPLRAASMAAARPAGPAPTHIISYLRMNYSIAVIWAIRILRLLKYYQ